MLAVPPGALLLGSRVSVGPASLLAREHHLWSPVPEFIEAGGRETADGPQDALIAQGVGTHLEDGLSLALALTGSRCDSRLLASSLCFGFLIWKMGR